MSSFMRCGSTRKLSADNLWHYTKTEKKICALYLTLHTPWVNNKVNTVEKNGSNKLWLNPPQAVNL